MTRFIGGPYDGRDLPIDPSQETIWLPPSEDLEAFLEDVKLTADITWVCRYWLDKSVSPPVYRYRMKGDAVPIDGPSSLLNISRGARRQ